MAGRRDGGMAGRRDGGKASGREFWDGKLEAGQPERQAHGDAHGDASFRQSRHR
jgi:hypothetical protein